MKGTGFLPSPPDERDYQLRSLINYESDLPKSVIHRQLGPILDQGETPQCVAYSISSLKTWHEYKQANEFIDFDEANLYWRCKAVDGSRAEGTYIRVAMKLLKNEGIVASRSRRTLQFYRVASYWSVPTDKESICRAIYQMGPVVLGGLWYQSWYGNLDSVTACLPKPDKTAGGHAYLAYGYSELGVHCRNSWGLDWGRYGRFVIPWAYLGSVKEAWKTLDE